MSIFVEFLLIAGTTLIAFEHLNKGRFLYRCINIRLSPCGRKGILFSTYFPHRFNLRTSHLVLKYLSRNESDGKIQFNEGFSTEI